jgi:hypothetical protein
MNSTTLHLLLVEAKATAEELLDITGPVMLSPGHVHELAQAMLNLTDACQDLHRQRLAWMVAAARQQRQGERH